MAAKTERDVNLMMAMCGLYFEGGPELHVGGRAESDTSGQCHFSQIQLW